MLSSLAKRQKLRKLTASEGYETVTELIERTITDSVSPAICMNEGCDYTTEMEPDQEHGYCEVCGTNTVASALILAGII